MSVPEAVNGRSPQERDMGKNFGHFMMAATVASVLSGMPLLLTLLCAGAGLVGYALHPRNTIQR